MSDVRGRLDPEARAILDAVLAKWAAPGINNPNHETPSIDGDPSPKSVSTDVRLRRACNGCSGLAHHWD
jgi:hypothetical protein